MKNKQIPSEYESSTGFLDFVFLLAIGFFTLFVVALMLVNPDPVESESPKKAEFIISMEWNHDWNDDVDLWVRDPGGKTVSFRNKSIGFMNLEKDDLGTSNDRVRMEDGTIRTVELNREVVTVRGIEPGEYNVVAHIYKRKGTNRENQGTIKVEVNKLNPYDLSYKGHVNYLLQGQQLTLVNFKVDDDGKISGYNRSQTDPIVLYTQGNEGDYDD